MNRIVKVQSENGYAFQGVPRVGAFSSNKLVDFLIPNAGTYDLSRSYINFNMRIQNEVAGAAVTGYDAGRDTAAMNSELCFMGDVANTDNYLSDTASLVRNAQMSSANRGMVESVRRLDSLRQVLWALENDKKEKQDGLDKIGTFEGRRGLGNRTSSLIQSVIRNVNNQGVEDSDPTTGRVSAGLNRDFRIPLSDLFGVGNAMWNGRVYGETRIHLETNVDRLRIVPLGGSENTDLGPGGATAYGAMDNQNNTPALTPLTSFQTTLLYKDYQLNFPFYVGQAVEVNAQDSTLGGGGGGPIPAFRGIIESIDYSNNNNVSPPGGDEKMTIKLRNPWHTVGAGVANITAITMKAVLANPATSLLIVNKAEIVLNEMVGVDGPSEIDYRTYSTEEQTGLGGLNFFHQYQMEPNAQNMIVAHCLSNEITPNLPWTEYRLAIDNVDQTGNRSVFYGRTLHYDRILRFMNNRGQNISSIGLQAIDTDAAQLGNQDPIYPILETLPLKNSYKTVTLQLSAPAVEDVIVYKELVKTI